MARKDERSPRLRQASGAASAQDSTPNAEFRETVPALRPDTLVLDKRDLRNIVSVVILRDLREKICIRA